MIIGGHLDSVPNGGWLDGILNVLAGLEVLRAQAPESRPLTLKLVSWADEEGARFGRSLLGSSAAAGHAGARLRPRPDRPRRDGAARRPARARRRPRLGARRARGARRRGRLPGAAHRAGPGARVARQAAGRRARAPSASSATPCASPACTPTPGSTPMDVRRDAFLAAARSALAFREDAAEPRRRARHHRHRARQPGHRHRVQRHAASCRSTSARSTPTCSPTCSPRPRRPASGSPPRRAARWPGSASGRSSRSRSTPSSSTWPTR